MTRALCMLALCAACASDDTSDDAPGGGFEGVSHVLVEDLPAEPPQKLDVLLIIDDTVEIARYQEGLSALPTQFADAFVSTSRAIHDLHVAVATTDGTLRVTPSIGASYMTVYPEYDFSHLTNFTGTFVDALGRLTSVGATRTGSSQPLAAMREVLENNRDGFLRENASLGIVIVTASDDASPEATTEYVRFAKALKADPTDVYVAGITLGPSPRLDEFFASFPYRNVVVPIADGDYSPPFRRLAQILWSVLTLLCWDPPDSDPLTPGLQSECTFTAFIRDEQRLLQPCRFADDEFCWRWGDVSNLCTRQPAVEPQMPPWGLDVFRPRIRIECVVR